MYKEVDFRAWQLLGNGLPRVTDVTCVFTSSPKPLLSRTTSASTSRKRHMSGMKTIFPGKGGRWSLKWLLLWKLYHAQSHIKSESCNISWIHPYCKYGASKVRVSFCCCLVFVVRMASQCRRKSSPVASKNNVCQWLIFRLNKTNDFMTSLLSNNCQRKTLPIWIYTSAVLRMWNWRKQRGENLSTLWCGLHTLEEPCCVSTQTRIEGNKNFNLNHADWSQFAKQWWRRRRWSWSGLWCWDEDKLMINDGEWIILNVGHPSARTPCLGWDGLRSPRFMKPICLITVINMIHCIKATLPFHKAPFILEVQSPYKKEILPIPWNFGSFAWPEPLRPQSAVLLLVAAFHSFQSPEIHWPLHDVHPSTAPNVPRRMYMSTTWFWCDIQYSHKDIHVL